MENIYYCNIFLPPFANIDPLYFINNVVPVNEICIEPVVRRCSVKKLFLKI